MKRHALIEIAFIGPPYRVIGSMEYLWTFSPAHSEDAIYGVFSYVSMKADMKVYGILAPSTWHDDEVNDLPIF